MKRYLILFLTFIFFGISFVSAQQNEIGTPDANNMEDGLPQQALTEISVDKFEQEGFWSSAISSDTGYASSRLFEGGPKAKQPLEGEQELGLADNKVFGTRVDFLRRGHTSIFLTASRPIPVEGLTKTVSVWVAGRNYNHKMSLLIQDFYGRYFEIYMGRLNFQGWKKMVCAIPPQQEMGMNGIVQQNYHYSNISGIKIIGFRIDCDPMEALGSYYIYIDDLRAVTDLFSEDYRDPDDPVDDW
ncbi:MAG: flagellar filament outer layer protein FlaA [Termitinemataceae bacterium]|nr:MAG: flagellar filament outer layer protein FlaA [Termitinemataceae bacterium]